MEAAAHPWPALGALLLRDGLVTKEALEAILDDQSDTRQQRISGRRLGELLVERGTVTQTQVAELVAEQYELPFVDLDVADIDLSIAALLPEDLARRFTAVAIGARQDGSYLLAIADPGTVVFSDELRRTLGGPASFVVVGPDAIDAGIDRVYGHTDRAVPPQDLGPRVEAAVVAFADNDTAALDPRAADEPGAADEPYFGSQRTVAHLWPPLGALLIREGLVNDAELEAALAQQRLSANRRLGEILVDRGVVTPAEIARLVAEQYELPFVDLGGIEVDPIAAALLPEDIAHRCSALPIGHLPDGSLEIVVADPTNVLYSDELRLALGVPLSFAVAAPDEIDAAIRSAHDYAHVESVPPVEQEASASVVLGDPLESSTVDDPEGADAPDEGVVALVAEDGEEPVVESLSTALAVDRAPEASAFGDAELVEHEDAAEDPAENSVWPDLSPVAPVAVVATELADVVDHDEPSGLDVASDTPAAFEPVGLPDAVENDTAAWLDVGPDAPVAAELVDDGGGSDLGESDDSADLAVADSEIYASVVTEPADEDTVGDEPRTDFSETTEATSDGFEEFVEQALSLGASSIHISPQPHGLVVRARVDGVIRELESIPTALDAAVVARLRTSPRAVVLSTKHGDRLTLDLRHEAPPSVLALADLGLAPDHEQTLRAAIDQPSGAILVCGPARSGRTTTVYGALQELNTPERAVITVEDPIAQLVTGLDQIEVDPSAGITFARGVRTILRSDPDVILVGETRDRDTAVATFGAASTGHLVLSTLHASSTASAIRRVTDLGVGPGLLGSTLTCLVAQRLVRRICVDCRESYYPSVDELAELGRPAEESGRRLLARGRGCASCGGSGYAGRVGLFEVLPLTEEIRGLVIDGASTPEIEREAVSAGMRTLLEDGARLCLDGVTTADEVRRVTGDLST